MTGRNKNENSLMTGGSHPTDRPVERDARVVCACGVVYLALNDRELLFERFELIPTSSSSSSSSCEEETDGRTDKSR